MNLIQQLEIKEERRTLSTKIPEILSHLELWKQKTLILSPIEKGKDVIQLCIKKKHYKLLICFLSKLEPSDLQRYSQGQDYLLVKAIESDDDNFLSAIITSYKRVSLDIRESIRGLPEVTSEALLKGSWHSEVILNLFGELDSYFIPRGQKKAKMYAMNFLMPSSNNTTSINMETGLKTAKFTVRKPIETWKKLKKSIEEVKEKCSLLVVWISTIHDTNKDTINTASDQADIDKVLNEIGALPNHIPAVSVLTDCLLIPINCCTWMVAGID